MNIIEQKEALIKAIEKNEQVIVEAKEVIKMAKAKVKKIEKLEKEMQDIFDDVPVEEELTGQMCIDVPVDEELTGQMCIDEYAV